MKLGQGFNGKSQVTCDRQKALSTAFIPHTLDVKALVHALKAFDKIGKILSMYDTCHTYGSHSP